MSNHVNKINPVLLIQMMYMYEDPLSIAGIKTPRTFTFTKNNRMIVHKETEEEFKKRKSVLNPQVAGMADRYIRKRLRETLSNRLGKVYIDPAMQNIAVPIQMATGQTGYGLLPTGSIIPIPNGKKLRVFTYWEKVNDIDISCFGLTEDFKQEEFSWRNMYGKQGDDITFSGDETSGYNGGSEYFDIDLDKFRQRRPEIRWVVFCNNIYSRGTTFDECFCKAGFMLRDNEDSGHIFEPKTVNTSYQINCKSTFAYLFAIDLEKRCMIWLNISRKSNAAVAGRTDMFWLKKYFSMTDIINVAELYALAGTPVEKINRDTVAIITDKDVSQLKDRNIISEMPEKYEHIHSYDFEKMLGLLTS